MKSKPKLSKLLPTYRVKLLTGLVIFILFLIVHSCSLFDNEKRDCYNIGRELTEEEKNIFPYNVGDSVFFTDGETDYYIYCDRIVDTIYTVSEMEDVDCEGGIDIDDEHIRYIYFKTDISLYHNCSSLSIGITDDIVFIILNNISDLTIISSNYYLFIQTDRIIQNNTSNTTNDSLQLYVDTIKINNKIYQNVYKLLKIREKVNHYVDTCYINKEKGFLKFVLNQNKIIELK